MAELSFSTRIIILAYLALAATATRGAGGEFHSERVINVHQPVYQPGYGNYQQVRPMFMTPPPPVVLENKIIEPTPVYKSDQVKIAQKVNVISHPMQFENPFNYYVAPRIYNPYYGPDSLSNMYHPKNMIYGPLPYLAQSGYGLPFREDGGMPNLVNQFAGVKPTVVADRIPATGFNPALRNSQKLGNGNRSLAGETTGQNGKPLTPIPVGDFDLNGLGFNTMGGVAYNPFSAAGGPFGPASPYATISDRQLRDVAPKGLSKGFQNGPI